MTNAYLTSALWGALFRDPEVEAAFSAKSQLEHMLAFEMAWTDALHDLGLVDAEAHGQATATLASANLNRLGLSSGSERDGLPVPELVRQLREKLPVEAQPALHSGATSQDVIDTALVLTCLDVLATFGARLTAILSQIDRLGDLCGQAPLMARTRMQAALPIRVSDRLSDWARPLKRHSRELAALKETIGVAQTGGPVGRRASHGDRSEALAKDVAKRLGLRHAEVWQTDASPFVDVGHWLTKVAGSLGKIGQDIALMAQQGIDEITLDGAGGSSAMPHKQNPVRAEILVAQARHVALLQAGLAQAMVHEQERSGAAMALVWMSLPAQFETCGAALNNARHLLGQVTRIGSPDPGD